MSTIDRIIELEEKGDFSGLERLNKSALSNCDALEYYLSSKALGINDCPDPELFAQGERIYVEKSEESEQKRKQIETAARKEKYISGVAKEAEEIYKSYLESRKNGRVNGSDFKCMLYKGAERILKNLGYSDGEIGMYTKKVMSDISRSIHEKNDGKTE